MDSVPQIHSHASVGNSVQTRVINGNVVQAGVINGNVVFGAQVAVPRELPAITARFIGRDAELDLLDEALSLTGDSGLPMVVLSGTAGVGKTALAVRWAHRAASDFRDGQLYVDLRGFGPGKPLSPMEALSGFLRSLGVLCPEELTTLAERSARFRTLMSGRKAVLVLDNARSEQQVVPLLPGVGSAVVLVTSRNQLGGLHIRYAAATVQLDPLPVEAGIRLLATSVGERVAEDAPAADALAVLCAGLPLALCIVAERLTFRPNLSLAVLATELGRERSRLESLSQVSDIRAVFSWSYRQLDHLGATVFRAIGLGPRRSFDASAISAVADLPVALVEQALSELNRSHLITEEADGRYSTHDLLRAYAHELACVVNAPLPSEAARRLFDHYLHTAERASRMLTPHRYRIPLAGDRLAGLSFSDVSQARHWLDVEESNLVMLSRIDDPALDERRWQLAFVMRDYFYLTKQLDGWVATHTNALDAAIRIKDPWAEAVTRNNLGMAMTAANRLDEAMRLYQGAKETFDRIDDRYGRSNALANIASVLRRRGEAAHALTYQQEALLFYRGAAMRGNVGITLRSMASAHLELGQAAEAILCAKEALDIATWLSYELDVAQAYNTLATAYRLAEDLTLAEISLRQALESSRRCESRFEEAVALRGLGSVTAATGRFQEARLHWGEAHALYQAIGSVVADAVAADLAALPE